MTPLNYYQILGISPRAGLEEIRRVLKRGGEVAILEFALPQRGVFAALYRFYFLK